MTSGDRELEAAIRRCADSVGVLTREGLTATEIDEVERSLGVRLPASYRTLLGHSNGMEVGYGYLRILGAGAAAPIDVVRWNDPEVWKFAWDWLPFVDLRRILVIGLDLYGNPIGFRHDDLGTTGEPPLVSVNCIWPSEKAHADSFGAWVAGPIMNHAHRPLYPVGDPVMEHHGPIPSDQLVLIDLPMLVGEDEAPELTVVMDATTVAIATGDLILGVGEIESTADIERIDPWTDARGRPRLSVTLRNTTP